MCSSTVLPNLLRGTFAILSTTMTYYIQTNLPIGAVMFERLTSVFPTERLDIKFFTVMIGEVWRVTGS